MQVLRRRMTKSTLKSAINKTAFNNPGQLYLVDVDYQASCYKAIVHVQIPWGNVKTMVWSTLHALKSRK